MIKISDVDLSSSEAPPLVKTNFSDFVKECHACNDLAQRIASYFPEVAGVWVGKPSERLTILFEHMWSVINKEDGKEKQKEKRVSWLGTGESVSYLGVL